MIRKESRWDAYAYRVGKFLLDETVKTVEEGQWVTIKGGKVVIAGKADKKAFICIGSKREGRDQVSGKVMQKVSFLVGPFAGLKVTNYDTHGSYQDMTPLCVKDGGILTPVTAPANEVIVAYAVGEPVDGHLEIISA